MLSRMRICLLGAIAPLAISMAFSSAARADNVYSLDVANTSFTCLNAVGACGSVTVSQDATNTTTELDFTVQLNTGVYFRQGSPGTDNNEAFWFNLSGFTGTLGLSNVTPTSPTTDQGGWTPTSGALIAGASPDGMGSQLYGLVLTLPNGSNFSNDQKLTFDITATGTSASLLLSDIVLGGTGGDSGSPFYFVAEVGDSGCTVDGNGKVACSSTGYIGADTYTVKSGQGEGVPGPLAGAGIPGLVFGFGGMIAWWRRRRPVSLDRQFGAA